MSTRRVWTQQEHTLERQARACSVDAGTVLFGANLPTKETLNLPKMLDFSSVSTQPQSSRLKIDDEDETVLSSAVQQFPLPQVQDVRPFAYAIISGVHFQEQCKKVLTTCAD